jgi:aryl-alcohol dehydrogenase-like predicted oxidoreductase
MTLPQNSLGRTGLSVTKLGNGAMEVRGPRIWGGRPIEDADAEQILNAVLDNGITFIDTANDYGRSEEYIGRFLSHRRDEFVLATKWAARLCAAATAPMTLPTCGPRRTCSAA